MWKKYLSWGVAVRLATVSIFFVLSVASIIFSIYMFMEVNSSYTFFLAIAFLSLAVFAGFFNIYASISYFRSYFYDTRLKEIKKGLKPLRRLPSVAVVMPVFNEDPELVKRNMTALFGMDYPKSKMRFYMLDDSTDRTTVEALESFCSVNGIRFIHRDSRRGYKAGAMNNMLKECREEFVAVMDADERLVDRSLLREVLPYFGDSKMAYVQTEKRSERGSVFSEAVDLFDGFFFRFIQPHRALNNTAIFAGSCGVIRKSVLDDIGGFPEYVIEDTFFSLECDLHNYKSIHIPKVYALGRPMLKYSSLVKQQWRYNYGDTQFIRYFMKRSSDSKRLSPWAAMDYYSHGFGLNYLSIVLILFTMLSVFIAFSTLPFMHLTITQFFRATYITRYLELFGGIAFVLSMIAPVVLTKVYFGSVKKGAMVFVLNFALAIARAKAAIAAIWGKSPLWQSVRGGGRQRRNVLYALSNTKTEIVLSASLLSMGVIAFLTNNIISWMWLSTYGILYLFSTVLFYMYG